jgi:multiple sugar transport system permease protein
VSKRSETRTGYLLLFPAMAVLAVLAVVPILVLLWLSLRYKVPAFGIDAFAGLEHYMVLLQSPRFWNSLGVTIYFAGVSVALETALGLGLALVLAYRVPGVGWARALILLPWAIPTVVTAKLWDWMYHPELGIVNYLLQAGALTAAPVNWLGTPAWAIHAAIIADVWRTTPFVVILLLAGLATISPDLYRAAALDGASLWQSFRHITLPLLRPILLVVVLFRLIDALRAFDLLYVMTGGGPADSTETLSIFAYKILFQSLQFGYGSAIGVTIFLIVTLASLLLLWLGRADFRRLVGRRT